MEFFDTIRQVRANWAPYKKWDIEQQKKEKQNQELRKKYPPTPQELKHAKQYGRTVVDVMNTMDQHSIDKSQDVGVVAGNVFLMATLAALATGLGLGNVVKKSNIGKKLPNFEPYWELLGMILTETVTTTIGQIWLAKVQKQASRIARFQTREEDLNDPRNFVIYDEEQIKKAQEIAKTLPEVEEKRNDAFSKDTFNPIKTYFDAKKTTDKLKKDDAKYQEWKKKYLAQEEEKKEAFKTLNPPQEALGKAQKERDAMLNTIKKIEINSLEYLNNMQMATFALAVLVTSAGTAIGWGSAFLLHILEEKGKIPKYKAMPAIKGLLALVFPIIGSMVALAPTNKLIKDAARIGRYKAKKELLDNPENFIFYDDEKKKSIPLQNKSDIEERKGLWSRFKKDMAALKQLKKDYAEYQNYMNTTHKEELKLKEALKQIDISDQQEADAKQLQKKAFHSFEKMDEKAQRFTDDTDAAVDITKCFIAAGIGIVSKLATILICGKEVKRINHDKVPKHFFKVLKLILSGKIRGKVALVMVASYLVPNFLHIPVAVKGIQVKKDAGKIGVMTAMEDMDDPKNFLDDKNIDKSDKKFAL